ncbi:SLOG domain-containing protein [Elizabethkingia anophelis]|uniref:SLOG domain-containing protein n=1 Tax=Elizabethkingia anophelis TaxID=1117645 RepID=UPI0038919CAA
MAKRELKNIFLSASIPFKERHPKYFESADIIAIRDSVIALASVVLPKHRLIWGGHPSITPIIYYVMDKLRLNIQEHFVLYQSKYFEHLFPKDNNKFQNVILTDNLGSEPESLLHMRERMLKENTFDAGVFIGGMEGIEDEFNMFKNIHPKAVLLPIASTGAAAKILYEDFISDKLKNERLVKDYGYMSLFQKLLIEAI